MYPNKWRRYRRHNRKAVNKQSRCQPYNHTGMLPPPTPYMVSSTSTNQTRRYYQQLPLWIIVVRVWIWFWIPLALVLKILWFVYMQDPSSLCWLFNRQITKTERIGFIPVCLRLEDKVWYLFITSSAAECTVKRIYSAFIWFLVSRSWIPPPW